jgi:hypothetical protein
MFPLKTIIEKDYYENTNKTAISSGIDSQASLLGPVRNQRYRSCEESKIVEKNSIQNTERTRRCDNRCCLAVVQSV